MKAKIFKTILLLAAIAVWSLLRTWALYLLDMQYSAKIAPDQFADNTNAYQLMKAYGPMKDGLSAIYYLGFALLVVWIVWIWLKNKEQKLQKTN